MSGGMVAGTTRAGSAHQEDLTMKLKTQKGISFGSNILAVEVPDALRVKVKTGLDFIDGVMGGEGLTPSSSILFTGTPGAGKTTMMLSMCDALVGRGSIAVFNTAEESLFQVKMVAERLKLTNGFAVGEETMVSDLLKKCDVLRLQNPDKPFVLVIDSLQTMNDGKWGSSTNSSTPVRVLQMITDWCKETNAIAFVIGQVSKDGKFAGKNTLKHMVDAMLELSIETDMRAEMYGCRMLETSKNRFGGSAYRFFLDLKARGFKTLAKVGD
jgi:DNA repair protein RadA/Sms